LIKKYHTIKVKQDHIFGIVYLHNGTRYFIPLASPKEKHKYIKNNTIDVYKIKNGNLGLLNINNMIPAPLEVLEKLDLTSRGIEYKNLLQNQLNELNDNKIRVVKKAEKLYKVYIDKSIPQNIIDRCCNFPLLEEKEKKYKIEI
jgi:protein AbiQ